MGSQICFNDCVVVYWYLICMFRLFRTTLLRQLSNEGSLLFVATENVGGKMDRIAILPSSNKRFTVFIVVIPMVNRDRF